MIIFLRHAERGDNQLPIQLSQISYDPPTTKNSTQTIKQTCKQLSQIFKQNNIKYFNIICSKFLRCLMTANIMQQILNKYGYYLRQPQYIVDDRIGEYLREDWYQRYPMSELIYHTPLLNKYISHHKFKQIQFDNKFRQFPENYVKFHFRVASFKKDLKFPQPNTCLLVVTHGFVVRELCFTMNQLPKYQNQIKYCGYAAYKKINDGEVLIRSKL